MRTGTWPDKPPVPAGGSKLRERRDIASGESLPETALVRFALSPEGEVVPDILSRLPGRGAWVSANRQSIEKAVKKGLFSRGFETTAKAPDDLANQVEALLARRCLDLLGLARRSSDVVAGFDQVRESLRKSPPGQLIEASDGAEDGRGKVLALARIHGPDVPLSGCFTAAELGMALGREPVIHVLMKTGRFADAWAKEIARLGGFRAPVPENWLSVSD